MQTIKQIENNGCLNMYRIVEKNTLRSILKEIKLDTNFFVVLVNGKQFDLDDIVKIGDEILVLPRIAGGY